MGPAPLRPAPGSPRGTFPLSIPSSVTYACAQEVSFDKRNCFCVLYTRTRARLTWCRPKWSLLGREHPRKIARLCIAGSPPRAFCPLPRVISAGRPESRLSKWVLAISQRGRRARRAHALRNPSRPSVNATPAVSRVSLSKRTTSLALAAPSKEKEKRGQSVHMCRSSLRVVLRVA